MFAKSNCCCSNSHLVKPSSEQRGPTEPLTENSVAFQVPAVIHPSPLFVSCRGCGLQDSSLCADHRHRDGYPHDDLHRHREIPRHRVPAENEEAVLAQKSVQDARYPIYTLKQLYHPKVQIWCEKGHFSPFTRPLDLTLSVSCVPQGWCGSPPCWSARRCCSCNSWR